MGNINLLRVLYGGLLAGLIINIGEYILNDEILGAQWAALRLQYDLPILSVTQSVALALITFVFGIVTIWIYAAIRPRFGPGPKTAIIAGLTMWAIAWLLFSVSMYAGGMLPADIMIVTVIWGFFEAPIAAVAGAWLYRESEAT